MKKILFALLALTMLLTACASEEKAPEAQKAEEAPKAEKLTVATDTNFPPFEFKDPATGNHTGFDVELWAAIAKEIGVEYDLQPMDFNGIIPGLQSSQVDVGIAGMTIKPERQEVVDFSDGYYNAGLLILVRTDNADVNGVED